MDDMQARTSADQQTINELLDIMHQHDLDTIKVRVGDAIFELVRRDPTFATVPVAAAPATAVTPASASAPAAAAGPPPSVKRVTAPLTGVFYRSPSPDTEAFVNIGERVDAGATICILEAMKLFNEIQSDYAGVVTRIIPENGELVSQGDDLFWIEP